MFNWAKVFNSDLSKWKTERVVTMLGSKDTKCFFNSLLPFFLLWVSNIFFYNSSQCLVMLMHSTKVSDDLFVHVS